VETAKIKQTKTTTNTPKEAGCGPLRDRKDRLHLSFFRKCFIEYRNNHFYRHLS
jgi:hypothetical protein